MNRPRISVTMGDPAGVGPEICLRLLQHDATLAQCVPIIFGDSVILKRAADNIGLRMPSDIVPFADWKSEFGRLNAPTVVDIESGWLEDLAPGKVDARTAAASYRFLKAAIDVAIAGDVDALTTGPIHKEALNAAGVRYPGHTELLASMTNARRTCMMLTSSELTCSLVTTHIGLGDVPKLLSVDRILEVIELSHEVMRRIRGPGPRLAVCGLNPHAGEHGLFGDNEEERFIVPAIEAARVRGIQVDGPLPPDTAFLPDRRLVTDCYVCMYHDQGLIPLKTLAFEEAVNVTLGLPIVRTSVDHGPALDIAWKGIASPTSLVQAVSMAVQLAESNAEMPQAGQ